MKSFTEMISFAHIIASMLMMGAGSHLLMLLKLSGTDVPRTALRVLLWGLLCGLIVWISGLHGVPSVIFGLSSCLGMAFSYMVMTFSEDRFSIQNDLWLTTCVGLALFLPDTFTAWVVGTYWPKVMCCALALPACFLPVPSFMKIRGHQNSEMTDWDSGLVISATLYGAIIGLLLTDSVIVGPWNVWPPVPSILLWPSIGL